MFKNYIKLAWRNIKNNKGFSFINIFGFALGIYVFLIISLYVYDDMTFDHHFDEPENIYRVISNDNSKDWISAVTVGPLYPLLAEEVPEVEAATRIGGYGVRILRADVEMPDSLAVFRRAMLTDSGFFGVFRPRLLSGGSEDPLADPQGVYLTESTAAAVFGEDDPLGKALDISFLTEAHVAGIVADPPTNTHLQYGVIMWLDVNINPLWWDSWENLTLTGYVRITDQADPELVEDKIIKVARDNNLTSMFTPVMQPLLDMHLHSMDLRYDAFNRFKGDITVFYSLFIIAFLVLIVASINFINISSARSVKRSREVGMRKVVGARRSQLAAQFLLESIIYTLVAMLIAVVALEVSLPYLQGFLTKPLDLNILNNPLILLLMILLALLIGFLSGLYPAFLITSFKAVNSLKGEMHSGGRGFSLRKILVVSQFSISIALICSVLVVISQIKYLQRVDFGYEKEDVLLVPTPADNITLESDVFKENVLQISGVNYASRVRQLPGRTLPTAEVFFDHREGDHGVMTDEMFVDEDFIKTLNIELHFGRNFIKGSRQDSAQSVLINETMYGMSGWKDPVGRKIIHVPADGQDVVLDVIGVIDDIHFGDAKQRIEPMIVHYVPQNNVLMVKIQAENFATAREEIQSVYEEIWQEGNYRDFTFDEVFGFQFEEERDFVSKIAVFSALAILIACLGLFGLAIFVAEQRTKEIGVRKVMGSSVRAIMFLLSMDFAKLVLFANIIAWPIAYIVMNQWLRNFAYRTPINLLLFFVSGLVALIIAVISVSVNTIKAATANPVDALKYE